MKHTSTCGHLSAARVSAAVGSKVRFLSSQKVRAVSTPWGRPHSVACTYGYGPSDADEVVLVLTTFPKPVGSLAVLKKLVGGSGPDAAAVQGVYTGLGVPAVILELKGPGTSRTPGIAAVRATHYSLAFGAAGTTLPLPALGKLALLTFSI